MRDHTATDEECWQYRRAQGNLGAHTPECYGRETRCMMPTTTLQTCKRPATVFYRADSPIGTGPHGRIVAQYCAQHDHASGRAAILRPRPWEYNYRQEGL